MEFISIVIPLYNKAPYIGRALESVLSQTVKNFEIIVVDDGSTDGGGDVVKKISSPTIHLFTQKNYGVSSARNHGISRSRGDLIAFLDADDAWKPKFLEKILMLRNIFPQAGAYATSYDQINNDGLIFERHLDILPTGMDVGLIENYLKVMRQLPLSSSSIAIPKHILSEIGGFHLYEDLSEDVDVWVRIALRYPIAWSDERLVTIYKNAENRAVSTKRFFDEPIVSRTIRYAIRAGIVPRDDIQDMIEFAAHFQIGAARHCIMQGRRRKAAELLGHAKGTKQFARKRMILRFFAFLPFNIGSSLLKMIDKGYGKAFFRCIKIAVL